MCSSQLIPLSAKSSFPRCIRACSSQPCPPSKPSGAGETIATARNHRDAGASKPSGAGETIATVPINLGKLGRQPTGNYNLARMPRRPAGSKSSKTAKAYDHKESEAVLRPEIGIQAQFKKKKDPAKYRYDRSLDPQLSWDINADREHAEALIEKVRSAKSLEEARAAADELKRMSSPFLNWAGKAERNSFSVPTLPLFVHERLSTEAILKSVQTHKQQLDLFADPKLDLAERVLRAYEHKTGWVNRLILGDSLVVMNSLLKYEGLAGQVQCIYVDPPYGVKFGSNFQPFIRKRDVRHNDDADLTREPEMVQAYRDTWELGLHSYLTYLRDRFLLCRELLHPSGSIFVQISDENLHHVRELLDEVFGAENFCSLIVFRKAGHAATKLLGTTHDFILWFAKDIERVKYRQLYESRSEAGEIPDSFDYVELPDGSCRRLSQEERLVPASIQKGAKIFQSVSMESLGYTEIGSQPFEFQGRKFEVRANAHWKTSREGMQRLAETGRLMIQGESLRYKMYLADFPVLPRTTLWDDVMGAPGMIYVVQTNDEITKRCLLMTTDPGDLVLDPTCGSGTTAYVAEQWGRRWISIDTSRVPLALARQRLLTATFPWYQLKDEARGPAGGFVYVRKQNKKGEEIGGIVPHITLESIANNEPPKEEVLVDRPEVDNKTTRVTGPFCVEGTIPTPIPADAGDDKSQIADSKEGEATYVDRMLEVLRKSPVLRLSGNRTMTLRNIRPPAKTLSLSAEAVVEGNGISPSFEASGGSRRAESEESQISDSGAKPVALVFGPENGAVSERLVQEAAREAALKNYTHLYVIGFAIQPNARQLIENCDAVAGIPTTYIQATPDLMMGDLRKNMRSSQIFSVCGLPEIKIHRVGKDGGAASRKPAAGAESQIADSKFQSTAGAGSQVAD